MKHKTFQVNASTRLKNYLLLAFVLMGFSCSANNEGTTTSTNKAKTITYWSSPNPQEYELAKELVEEWNAKLGNVQVLLQALPAGQSSEEVLLSAMVAGTTPDICSNIWPGITNDFIRAKGLIPLDVFDDYQEVMEQRVPTDILESVIAEDGHTYQIPWKTNPIMVQYNVKMFRDAGIDTFPRTYSEFLEAADKITKDIDGDGRIDQWMGFRDIRPIWWQRYYDYYTSYITASGGNTLFDKGDLAIDEKASNEVFDFYQQLYSKGYFPRSSLQGNAFLYNRIAVEFTGPWNISYLEKNAPPSLEYNFAPVPVPDHYEGEVYTYGDHKNIAIFSNTKHPKESWEFAKFLISKEADYRLLSFASQIPIRKELLTDPEFATFFRENPSLARFAEQAAYTRGVDNVRDFKEILDAVARYYEIAAVYGKITPEEATKEMISAIEVLREWNK